MIIKGLPPEHHQVYMILQKNFMKTLRHRPFELSYGILSNEKNMLCKANITLVAKQTLPPK